MIKMIQKNKSEFSRYKGILSRKISNSSQIFQNKIDFCDSVACISNVLLSDSFDPKLQISVICCVQLLYFICLEGRRRFTNEQVHSVYH